MHGFREQNATYAFVIQRMRPTTTASVTETHAVLIDSFEDAPHLAELSIPEVAGDQVLIRLRAASLNAFDWKAAEGRFKEMFRYDFPVTIGRDYAGVVESVGASVTRVAVGDAVFGYFSGQTLHRGAFAEHVWVSESECFVRKPDGISFQQAAALPLCGMVAYRCVDAVAPQQGEKHLVLGAPGGVGSYVVQLLAARGAHVIASGLPEDERFLRDLGAAEVVDHRSGIVDAVCARHPDGVDGLVDLVSYQQQLMENVALLKRGGRVASLHRSTDPDLLEPLGVTGANIDSRPDPELLARIGADAAAGALRVPIERTFALADVPRGLEVLKNEHARGKYAVAIGETA